MPLSDIVNVQITRETQTVSQAGFGTLMILGANKYFNDLIRKYANMQEVANDFQPYDLEYIAAQDVFSQPITPPYIYIGRRTVDTVGIEVETALPAQTYTATINGNNVSVNSTPSVSDSVVTLSGIVTNVINFNIDFISTSVITSTVNSVALTPVSWTTDQATTISAVAAQIALASGVTSATVTGARQITVVFASSSSAIVNSVVTVGTGTQPVATITQSGPLVTGNRINVSLNGTIVGTVTSILDFDIDFVASNSIVATVNGVALSAVLFNTDQATTIGDLATQIALASGVTSATVTGARQITVVFTSAGNNTVDSVITTLGATQPVCTISEGAFVFTTDQLTTMTNIANAIEAVLNTGYSPGIATVSISGTNDNVLTVNSNPNQAGVISFFTVSLGASQATASIVNSVQATDANTIADALKTAINAATLGVTASTPSIPDGTLSITANVAGVPYTLSVSSTVINPNKCRVLITQAIPNQSYTIIVNGTSYIYQAENGVVDNETIAAGLVALINASTNPVPITATDNLNGSLDIESDNGTDTFIIQVKPVDAMSIQKGLIISPYTPSASVVTDLEAIQDVNNDWYALACTDRTSATVQAIAAWIETQIKIFGTASSDSNIISKPPGTGLGDDSTSIAYLLFSAGYVRSFVMYHAEADLDFPECAWFGKVLPLTPGSETWKFKTLNSITYSDLSSNEENNAFAKNANTYEYIGGVGITQNGTMAQGEFIDIIRGVDWLTSTIQSYVYSVLVNLPKVPYTDAGITAIESQIQRALTQGVSNNFIASEPPFNIIVPKAANVSSVDKANRILTGVSFTATLAGAIHAVQITGTVSV